MSDHNTEQTSAGNQTDSTGSPAGPRAAVMRLWREPLSWTLVAVPLALGLEFGHAGPLWVFIVSGIAIVPLAGLMGRATENLAQTLGPGIGGLLNATFGNAAELIIAILLLWRGPEMYQLIKASITGSIIGNSLLVLGLAILLGGMRYRRQKFNRTAAGMGATLLALASAGLLMPTLYYYLLHAGPRLTAAGLQRVEYLSEEIAAILAVVYLLSLLFSLGTHQHLFGGDEEEETGTHPPEWSRSASLTVLVLATAGIAVMGELLVGSVEHAAKALGMNEVFIGVIVVAVIGNAAEHSTAAMVAMKNKMDLAVHIAVGSSIQVALFVAPVLVFASMLMGHSHPLDLHFTPLEIITVIFSVGVLALICQDGETHWMEGVMLLALYIIMALAFYHLPEEVISATLTG
jgi:Ca2+:H+ antiporter